MSENPYKPPVADVSEAPSLMRSIWWKVYFFIITIISLLGMASYLTIEEAGAPEFLSFILLIPATVGLFGYVFLKKILSANFWLIFFWVYLGFSLLYSFITKIDLQEDMSTNVYYISMAIGWLFSLPGLYALYSYGKSNNPIWSQ